MENNKKLDITKNVLALLEVSPETRDNDWELSMKYLYHFWNGTKEEFIQERMPSKIERTRRELQHNNTKLRGKTYEARQIHAMKIREEKSRSHSPEKLEKTYTVAEDVSYKFEKETKFQWLIRKLLNF